MNSQQNNMETLIKKDLENSLSGVRVFHEHINTTAEEITRNVLKYAPTSVVLNIKALKEFGKTAILLEIEKQLVSISNKLTPNLTSQLKAHLSLSRIEIYGEPPLFSEHPRLFASTLINFCVQLEKNQKTILQLEFDDVNFKDEFLDFTSPLIEDLPNKLFVYIFVSTKKTRINRFNYKPNPSYYWGHPTELGSDLYFLLQNSPSSLIEHLTDNENSLLLRLWNLHDVAIPIGEKAMQFVSNYSHQEIGVLIEEKEFRFTINNTDEYEAKYKLCRELAYHYYTNNDNLEKANHFRNEAIKAINKSSISDTIKTKHTGLIWGDYAQFAKRNLKLSEAINALTIQKMIYEVQEGYYLNELSAVEYNLGVCYRASGDYKKALIELNRSFELAKRANKPESEIEALLETGKTYVDLGDYQASLMYFKQIENSLPEKLNARLLYIKGTILAYMVYLNKELGTSENLQPLAERAIHIFSELGAEEDITKLQEVLRI